MGKWVTRAGAKVDRVACPWLIVKFIDPQAEFLFVPADQVQAVAAREGAIAFDAAGVELGHSEGRCSFETILAKYGLADPALQRLARIVHGADIAADLGTAPESAGLKAFSEGMALVVGDDHEKLRLATPLYDALYAYCRSQARVAH
ncbi:MAG: chromate resistance protein [Chloroflexi bacterium]|nr:chromate resistance protein [Chloroflexota bacterium]